MGNPPPQTPQPPPAPSWQQTFEYYNPLHRRRKPTSPPVLSRDFAYAHNGPTIILAERPMRHQINAGTSAKTFADYGLDEAKKLHKRLLSGPTVDIYVGKERKHWSLHRNLLCHHSSYFETEFEGHEVPRNGRTEGGENRLDLSDDDPAGFELLVKWLYQGQLEDSSLLDDEQKYDYAVACHKLYILCDKFDMIHLKNLAMDQYRANLNAAQLVPDADEINEIYRASPAGSPFRGLMTQIAARQIMDPDVDKDAESYRQCFMDNADFAVEMVNAIRSMSGGMLFDDPTEGDECDYHDHSDGSTCTAALEAKKPRETNKARPVTDGTGPPPTAKSSIVRKQLPAELSAERRTPRKLNVPDTPRTPTPNGPTRRPAVKANGNTPVKRPVLTNGTALQPAKAANVPPSQPAMIVAGGPRKVAPPSVADASSQNGGPRKLSQTPAKPPATGSSVLGKRGNKPPEVNGGGSSVASGPRELSQNVNGMVQQWNNGVNGVSGKGSGGRSVSEGSQSQSQAGAPHELAVRKAHPPKLRRASGVNGV